MLGILILINYIIAAACVQRIAKKLKVSKGWMAWVPFLNWYLACKLAGAKGWSVIVWLIPIVNLIWIILIWRRILGRLGRKRWPALFVLLPLLSLLVIGYAVLSKLQKSDN